MSAKDSAMSVQRAHDEQAELALFDAIPIAVSVLAPDGTTLYVNRSLRDHAGVTLEDVRPDGFLEQMCHPDDLDQILCERHRKLSQGIPFQLEMRLRART